jgi:hypothetical protein
MAGWLLICSSDLTSLPKRYLSEVAAISLPLSVPSTIQLLLPVSDCAPRAFLLVHDESLHERILLPVCWAISLPQRPDVRD